MRWTNAEPSRPPICAHGRHCPRILLERDAWVHSIRRRLEERPRLRLDRSSVYRCCSRRFTAAHLACVRAKLTSVLATCRLNAGCPFGVCLSRADRLCAHRLHTLCLSVMPCLSVVGCVPAVRPRGAPPFTVMRLHTVAARWRHADFATRAQLGLHRSQQRGALSQLCIRDTNAAQSLALRTALAGGREASAWRPRLPRPSYPPRGRGHPPGKGDRGHRRTHPANHTTLVRSSVCPSLTAASSAPLRLAVPPQRSAFAHPHWPARGSQPAGVPGYPYRVVR